jgi:glycerol-3-phosphate dehydrogenase (NAD(P)+)
MMHATSCELLSPVAVLGAGAWGTALAIQLSHHQSVRLWGRDPRHMTALQTTRLNNRYLPQAFLPETIYCTAQLIDAIQGAQDILVAIPSHALPCLFKQIRPLFTQETHLLLATKGLHPYLSELLPTWLDTFDVSYAFLSGPSFAQEVVKGLSVGLVVASQDLDCTHRWKQRLHQPNFQIYRSRDVIGVSLCGAMKNVVAIAVGIADGLALGENTRALLMTQGFAEMQELGRVLGGCTETLMGLAGIGDLSLTCMSDQSRNRRLGIAMGQGLTRADAQQRLGLLSEGAANTRAICELAQCHKIVLPLCKMVYTVLFDQLHPKEAVYHLINHIASYVAK